MMKTTIITIFLLTNSFAFDIDEKLNKPETKSHLTSGKDGDSRVYKLTKEATLKSNLKDVIKSITIYGEKCNAEFKDKRELISKDKNCKYHNDNLIETKKHVMMDKPFDKFFVLERRIYNRELFSNVDMVTVKKMQNGTIEINQRMLTDKESKRYIDNPVKRESVFQKTSAKYILTKIDKNTTKVDYTYTMVTDHWLLNKSIAASRVFDSMAEGTELLFSSIQSEIRLHKREVATVK